MIFDRITKTKILYKDISFQNMRINKNNEPIICDFDIVIESNSKTLGLQERMGTVQFMIIGILNGESHQAFHNCKSIS